MSAWFLARRLIPNQSRCDAYRQIRTGFVIVFALGMFCGSFGYAYGLWRGSDADYSSWNWVLLELEIADAWAFVRVAYIHNGSYFGGLIGLVVALVWLKPSRDCSMAGNSALPPSEGSAQGDTK